MLCFDADVGGVGRDDVEVSIVAASATHLGPWLRRIATDLAEAAASDPAGVFDVSADEIAEKMTHAKALTLAIQGSRVVGFMALRPNIRLARTGLTLAYIDGVIVHCKMRRQRIPWRLLMHGVVETGLPDVVAAHTQTSAMIRSLERWGAPAFPRLVERKLIPDCLVADLVDAMAAIGRDPGESHTGVCHGMYPKRLFLGERLPHLGDRDAIFIWTLITDQARRAGFHVA